MNIHGQGPITNQQWPVFNDSLLVAEKMTVAVQINGKTRSLLNTMKDENKELVQKKAMKDPKIIKHTDGKKILKTIFGKKKILNLVVK